MEIHQNLQLVTLSTLQNIWKTLKMIPLYLTIVEKGFKIDFLNITGNLKIPRIPHSGSEKENISIQIKSMLRKEVIAEGSRKSGNFISTVSTRKIRKRKVVP